MSTFAGTPAASSSSVQSAMATHRVKHGPAPLSGLAWLVWRQHRAAFWTLIALTVIAVAYMVHQRGQMMDYLNQQGWPHLKSGWDAEFEGYSDQMWTFGEYLGYAPLLIGVFVGAPLLAGDLETGTAKLVTAQSVSRARWIAAKLGLTALVVVAVTGVLSAVFGWWWAPVKGRSAGLTWSGIFFSTTGIVPVALALLACGMGAAAGMLLRRTLVSMVVTFGAFMAVRVIWDWWRRGLGQAVTVTSDQGVGPGAVAPELPAGAVEVGHMDFVTRAGERLDWTTCLGLKEEERFACLESKHVVGFAMDYVPMQQMAGLQWLAGGVVLALTAALTAFVLFWGRRQTV
ncbi:ABC transporter permease [Streptomyces sp. NPDC127197]|uniref:ABC transporter permease n=1 Tax=Streptomyces sp. NPDC127197 TaxID=3345388 RepID=UPI003639B586